ncbi:MAG TPA: hypothetical protein VGH00_07660, partial [Chthoniobacterales bacterium]
RANGGTGTAQECAERACRFGSSNDFVEKRDQFLPEWLVKTISESAAEQLVFARGKGGGDCACVTRIFDSVQSIDAGRKQPARFGGGNFKVGHEEHEMELCGNGKHLALDSSHDIETPVTRGRGIIGMTFERDAELENFRAFEWPASKLVQPVKNADPDGRAAPEPAGRRYVSGN